MWNRRCWRTGREPQQKQQRQWQLYDGVPTTTTAWLASLELPVVAHKIKEEDELYENLLPLSTTPCLLFTFHHNFFPSFFACFFFASLIYTQSWEATTILVNF